MAFEPQYNANCPYCGQQTLVATAQAENSNIPLMPTDYDFDEGTPEGTEITEIKCTSCGRSDILRSHYFDHGPEGEPCDCNEPITVHLEGGEEQTDAR